MELLPRKLAVECLVCRSGRSTRPSCISHEIREIHAPLSSFQRVTPTFHEISGLLPVDFLEGPLAAHRFCCSLQLIYLEDDGNPSSPAAPLASSSRTKRQYSITTVEDMELLDPVKNAVQTARPEE